MFVVDHFKTEDEPLECTQTNVCVVDICTLDLEFTDWQQNDPLGLMVNLKSMAIVPCAQYDEDNSASELWGLWKAILADTRDRDDPQNEILAQSEKDEKEIGVHTDPAALSTANTQSTDDQVFHEKPKQFRSFCLFDWLMYIQHYIFGDSSGTLNKLK